MDLIYISYIQRLLRAVPRYLKLKLYNERTEEGHSEREREKEKYTGRLFVGGTYTPLASVRSAGRSWRYISVEK